MPKPGSIGVKEGIIHEHEDYSSQKAAEDDTESRDGKSISDLRSPVQVPEGAQGCVLQKDYKVVDEQTAAGPSFLDVEPAEDVDDPHYHVKDNLLPLGDAELCLAVDDPEGHDAPVQDNEDTEVELEHRGEECKGDYPGGNGEEVPAELNDDS